MQSVLHNFLIESHPLSPETKTHISSCLSGDDEFYTKLSYDVQHIHITKHFEREAIKQAEVEQVERGAIVKLPVNAWVNAILLMQSSKTQIAVNTKLVNLHFN